MAEAFGEIEKGEGHGNGDVEALGEAIHGYLDVFVGEVDSLRGEACKFGAEDECYGRGDVEVGDEGVVGVGSGSDNSVAAAAQLFIGRLDVGVGVVVDPLGGAYGDVAGRVEGIVALHDMDVLDTEAVAGAEDGGGVVRLVDVFECHGDVACAQRGDAVDELAAVVGDKLRGIVVKGFLLLIGEMREERSQRTGIVEVDTGHGC